MINSPTPDALATSDHRPAAAIAILYQGDRFLLQLRDDKPEIRFPGQWAFCGGHLEPGETPAAAMHRELLEEIAHDPPGLTHYRSYFTDTGIIRHVFYAPLTVSVAALELNEGMDLELFTIEDVRQGSLYSPRIQQTRPLAQPHRQILLDFLEGALLQQ